MKITKGTNNTRNQRKSFNLLIYAVSYEAIERKTWVRALQWRNSNAKYFQSRSFMLEVLALSHLAPNAWSFSTSRPPSFTPTHKLHPLHPPLFSLRMNLREITKFPGSRLRSLRHFYLFFYLQFLSHVSHSSSHFTLCLSRYIPRVTKNYLS